MCAFSAEPALAELSESNWEGAGDSDSQGLDQDCENVPIKNLRNGKVGDSKLISLPNVILALSAP